MSRLLQEPIARHACLAPLAPAVVDGARRMTYRELEEASNRLARALRDRGCTRGDRICFAMPKSADAIVAILGILKADCTYTPLDTSSPASRVAHIVRSAEPRLVIGTSTTLPFLEQVLTDAGSPDVRIGLIDEPRANGTATVAFSAADVRERASDPIVSLNTPSDPAYIFFTSGSTGAPKGVVISHSNVWHFVSWANRYFGLGPNDRVSGYTPLHFDLSVYDVFGTLTAGAEFHLVPPEAGLAPAKLVEFIRAARLTQWFSVPSLLTYLAKADAIRQDDFPTLTRLLWCGEVLPTPVLTHWMTRLPHVTFTNLYGPTEATIASSYYTVPACPADEQSPIPIGVPCEGEELLVLDAHRRPVPPGTIGDLYIAGVGLSTGYWRDPEKTQAAFVERPGGDDRIYKTGDLARVGDDGLVYFLGRSDSQIKSRGYRIELGEIETALNALTALKESAVVAVQSDGFEGAMICCAYVPAGAAEVTPIYLRQALSKTLPSYMMPTKWLAYDVLPKNANGKVDRPLLREHFKPCDARADRTA
jgi:amino acid adenylation domain-containing protein